MPMQPGSSNAPQLRNIKKQQDQKKQATPTKTQTAQRGAKKKQSYPVAVDGPHWLRCPAKRRQIRYRRRRILIRCQCSPEAATRRNSVRSNHSRIKKNRQLQPKPKPHQGVPKRSNPTQLLLTGLIGFGVQRSADSSGSPPKAEDPDQMPMQPGSSNTPQLRKAQTKEGLKKKRQPQPLPTVASSPSYH